MTLQAFVRKMSPSAYKMAVRLRHSGVSERMMHMPSRLRARQLFRTGVNLTVTISGRMGLGGIFTNAANALAAGQAYGIDLDLRFTSPTYAPSWNHANSDWLEDYFVRYRPAQLRQAICDVRDIPDAEKATTLREKAELVWSYMGIQQKFADRASKYIPSSPFAAVHFRGSDKFLDAAPVQMKTVLDVVEANLRIRNSRNSLLRVMSHTFLICVMRDSVPRCSLFRSKQSLHRQERQRTLLTLLAR